MAEYLFCEIGVAVPSSSSYGFSDCTSLPPCGNLNLLVRLEEARSPVKAINPKAVELTATDDASEGSITSRYADLGAGAECV